MDQGSNITFTILGCANSYGVPYAGNDWGNCDPNEPKNRRTRCSLHIKSDNSSIIIDTGPDFRDHMNTHNIQRLDAVLYTHKHPDHTAGIDDLRIYAIRNKMALPAYMDDDTHAFLKAGKLYLIKEMNPEYPAIITPHIIKPFETITIKDLKIETYALYHGEVTSTGYRIGNLGYSLDMKDITDPKTFEALDGIETWIADVGAYQTETNPVHATIDKIIDLNQKIKAKRVIMSSLNNRIDYKVESGKLPEGYELAYDGLTITTD